MAQEDVLRILKKEYPKSLTAKEIHKKLVVEYPVGVKSLSVSCRKLFTSSCVSKRKRKIGYCNCSEYRYRKT